MTTFVTWRLADALPATLLGPWRTQREEWLRKHPRPWDLAIEEQYHDTFSRQVDEWLDAGAGSCLLRDIEVRSAVDETLLHSDHREYTLHAYVIMPNHVHVIFTPGNGSAWQKLVATWKSVSSHRINRRRGRRGNLSQEESGDRLIRNQQHFAASCRYVRENPLKAKLRIGEYSLFERACEPR